MLRYRPIGGLDLDHLRAPDLRRSGHHPSMGSAADASASWSETGGSPARPGLFTIGLVFFSIAISAGVIALSANAGLLAWDVRFAYLPAAEAVLDGDSPYPALDDPILEDQKGYVYPPQLLLALVPLTPLPNGVVGAIVAAGLLALLGLTLWILGIRDVRCYAAALLWVPALSGVLLGNISIPLAFAVAVAWRYRDGGVAAGMGARARDLGEVRHVAAARLDSGDPTASSDGSGRWRSVSSSHSVRGHSSDSTA